MDMMTERAELTDAVKGAVTGSGIIPTLKKAFYPYVSAAKVMNMDTLIEKAQAAVQEIEQLINSGKLDDAAFQKLSTVLLRLQGALQKGTVSPEALATAVAEARNSVGAVDVAKQTEALAQRMEQMWQKVDQCNKEINDDFEKMRRAGIAFDERIWNKHKSLSAYLDEHPKDIEQQKALDAVDDQLLQQAEPQLKLCPGAKPHYDDAKKKSEERKEEVAEIKAAIKEQKEQRPALTNADWGDGQAEDVSMNEVITPTIKKQKPETAKTSGLAK